MIVLPSRSGFRSIAGMTAGTLLLIALIALWIVPIGSQSLRAGAENSVLSRQQILATSTRAAADLMPFGSGAGTFRAVYQLYEDHDRLERSIVNHAHNDYVEIAVETGVPGVLLLAAFLLWWFGAAAKAWRSGGSPYARAAAVASAAILVHSFVDFPLRTAAISTVFAMCLGLLAEPKLARQRSRESSELRPTRQPVLGMMNALRQLWAALTSVMSSWHQAKLFVEHSTAVSHDSLHVIVGVIGFLILGLLMRRPIAAWRPWLWLLALALWNETVDLWVERWPDPGMQYGEGAKDLLLTMILPTVLLIASRIRPELFRPSAGHRARRSR